MARVIQVIETTEMRGKGDGGYPIREVTQYWSLDGELLAESDPLDGTRPTAGNLRGAQMLRKLRSNQ